MDTAEYLIEAELSGDLLGIMRALSFEYPHLKRTNPTVYKTLLLKMLQDRGRIVPDMSTVEIPI